MVQVTKQSVRQWAMFDYLSKKHRFQSDINTFERKYGMSLDSFEKRFEETEKESYDEWDDYIDWKAAHEFLLRINVKIQDLKNGNIELID